jgi:Na+/H+ antiporter NhaA
MSSLHLRSISRRVETAKVGILAASVISVVAGAIILLARKKTYTALLK